MFMYMESITDTNLIQFFADSIDEAEKGGHPPKNRAKRPKFTPYNANLSEWE